MNSERWLPYVIEGISAGKLRIDNLHHDGNTGDLSIALSLVENPLEKWNLKVIRPCVFRQYQGPFMEFRLKLLAQRHGKEFYFHQTFFSVENSQYVAWHIHELCGIGCEKAQHIAVVGANSIVDVILYERKEIFVVEGL